MSSFNQKLANLIPIAYYALTEAAGLTATDVTGNYNATFNGTPSLSQNSIIPSNSDRSVNFDGTDDYVSATSNVSFGDITLVAALLGSDGAIITLNDEAYTSDILPPILSVAIDANLLKVTVRVVGGQAGQTLVGTTNVNDGLSHLVSVTRIQSTGEVLIYLDGRLEASSVLTSGVIPIHDFTCGAEHLGSSGFSTFFTGKLSNCAFYNSALNETVTSQIYQNYAIGVTSTQHLALWKFDDFESTKVEDSKSVHTGTLNGAYAQGQPRLNTTPLDSTATSTSFVGGYVEVQHHNQFTNLSDASISFTLVFNPGSSGLVYGKANAVTPFAGLTVLVNEPSTGKVTFRQNLTDAVTTLTPVLSGTIPTRYTLVRRGLTLELWLNGRLHNFASIASITNDDGTQPLYLMGKPANIQSVVGTISNLSVKAKSMTAAEIVRDHADEFVASGYAAQVLSYNPDIYLKLSENVGTKARDDAGYYYGDLLGSVGKSKESLFDNISESSMEFLGSNQRVQMNPKTSDLAYASSPFSISMMFKFKSSTLLEMLISNSSSNASTYGYYVTRLADNTLKLGLAENGSLANKITIATTLPLLDNVPYHLVCTIDGGNLATGLTMYLNGAKADTTPVTDGTYTGDIQLSDKLLLASRNAAASDDFRGFMQHVALYPTELTQQQALALYTQAKTASPYLSQLLTLAPIWHFRLGEVSGVQALANLGGEHGTYTGNPTLGVKGLLIGDSDTCVELDGITQYVDVGHVLTLSSFSISVILETVASTGVVFDNKVLQGYQLSLVAGTIQFTVRTSTTEKTATSPSTVNDGKPHHIVGTRSGATIRLYVDGVEVSTESTSATTDVAPVDPTILGASASLTDFFAGKVDEPALFNKVLTPTQVSDLYLSGNIPEAAELPDTAYSTAIKATFPTFYYRFEETVGSAIRDSSGNEYHAGHTGTGDLTLPTIIPTGSGTGIGFDQTNYVQTVNIKAGSANSDMTIMFWSKPKANNNTVMMVSDTSSSLTSPKMMRILYSGGKFRLHYNLSGSLVHGNTVTSSTDVTVHITLTYNGTTGLTNWYKDGVVGTPFTLPTGGIPSLTALGMTVGAYYRGSVGFTERHNGDIDEPAYWDLELSAAQILTIYNSHVAVPAGSPTLDILISENKEIELFDIKAFNLNDDTLSLQSVGVQAGLTTVTFDPSLEGVPHYVTVLPSGVRLWKPSQAYAVGELVFASNPGEKPYYFKCVAAGLSSAVEPIFATNLGSTTQDSSVSWITLESIVQPITQNPLIPRV
jgi:hypothetical protein